MVKEWSSWQAYVAAALTIIVLTVVFPNWVGLVNWSDMLHKLFTG